MEITVKVGEELAMWALSEAERRGCTTGEVLADLIEAARAVFAEEGGPAGPWQ